MPVSAERRLLFFLLTLVNVDELNLRDRIFFFFTTVSGFVGDGVCDFDFDLFRFLLLRVCLGGYRLVLGYYYMYFFIDLFLRRLALACSGGCMYERIPYT